jgi:hypothetical protein
MPSRLPGSLAERLFDAVLGAYSKQDLQRVLWFNLDTDLNHIVPDDALNSIVFGLIRHLDRTGQVDTFLEAIEKDRPQSRQVQEVVQEIRAGWAERAPAGGGRPARLAGTHPLHQFPPGPMVPFEWVPRSLVNQFATRFFDPEESRSAILDAIRERHAADPGATTITLEDLLTLGRVPPRAFWGDALIKACPHGPRMVAALVGLIPEGLFTAPARAERSRLLLDLRDIQ